MAHASSVSASAPGSLMLLGEHAVLRGKQALVLAIDKRMDVKLTARDDQTIHISSSLGEEQQQLSDLSITGSTHTFVVAALLQKRSVLAHGLDIVIRSAFEATWGLGSSAAVTAATTAALTQMLEASCDHHRIFQDTYNAVRAVQGTGSGADIAASVFGGIVNFNTDPLTLDPLDGSFPITVVYSGSKMPTVEVIARVNASYANEPERYDRLFADMHDNTLQAIEAIRAQDGQQLGQALNKGQDQMRELGVCNEALEEIVGYLLSDPNVLGAKISGSGLGDCVIALGEADCSNLPYQQIDVQMSSTGVTIES